MSELLTREQVEQLFQFASIAELSLAILKHDAALRAKLEEAENERDEMKYRLQVHADLIGETEHSLRKQLAAMTKERDYAQQMITTQESIIENLGRERDRYRALLEGKP